MHSRLGTGSMPGIAASTRRPGCSARHRTRSPRRRRNWRRGDLRMDLEADHDLPLTGFACDAVGCAARQSFESEFPFVLSVVERVAGPTVPPAALRQAQDERRSKIAIIATTPRVPWSISSLRRSSRRHRQIFLALELAVDPPRGGAFPGVAAAADDAVVELDGDGGGAGRASRGCSSAARCSPPSMSTLAMSIPPLARIARGCSRS